MHISVPHTRDERKSRIFEEQVTIISSEYRLSDNHKSISKSFGKSTSVPNKLQSNLIHKRLVRIH